MYESPISVTRTIDQIVKDMRSEDDDLVYKYVIRLGVSVDKDQLLSALRYDRQQYDHGYRDGFNDGAEHARKKVTEEIKAFCCGAKMVLEDT